MNKMDTFKERLESLNKKIVSVNGLEGTINKVFADYIELEITSVKEEKKVKTPYKELVFIQISNIDTLSEGEKPIPFPPSIDADEETQKSLVEGV
jgi:preprotein translocase subunit YajC